MKDLVSGELKVAVSEQDGQLVCKWTGRSVERASDEVLMPFFEELLEHASTNGLAIRMKFDELEHFNSSTISTLIVFIQKAKRAKAPLIFVYDAKLKWQRLSFDALKMFEKSNKQFTLSPVNG